MADRFSNREVREVRPSAMKAIIVEDEFLAAIHAESALEGLGVEVVGMAEDRAGALALANEELEVALVDLNLRDGFTGPSIGMELAHAGIRVVFVTANPSDLNGLDTLQSPVLEKPLEQTKLGQVLELDSSEECRRT